MTKKTLKTVFSALFWILLWQIFSMVVGQELLVPSPFIVLITLGKMMVSFDFWSAVLMSMLRVAAGFILAVICGVILAVFTVKFSLLHSLFSPLLQCNKAAPVASFIILALVWLPTGLLPVFICFLMVVPIVWSNVEQGIKQTDMRLVEMGKVFGMNRWKMLWKICIPSVMPYLMSALTTGLGFAWKSGIAAEVICQPAQAMGKQLYFSKLYLETPRVFAWTAVVIVLSVILEKILKKGVAAVAKKYGFEGEGVA